MYLFFWLGTQPKKTTSKHNWIVNNIHIDHPVNIHFFHLNIIQDEDVDIEEEIDLYDPVSARDEELSGNALLWSSYIVQEVDMKESSMWNVSVDLRLKHGKIVQ